MKNFGKMSAVPTTLYIPGMQIGLDEEDNPIFSDDVPVNVIIFQDMNGLDMVEAAKADPHPFYIAVSDDGFIVSMSDDIEKIQMADCEIVGVDGDFGYTFDQNGTVYGKQWDGQSIVDPLPTAFDVDQERDRRTIECFRFEGQSYQLDGKSIDNITAMGADSKFAILSGAVKGDVYWADPDNPFEWITTDNNYTPMDAHTMSRFTDAAKRWVSGHISAARKIKDGPSIPLDYTDDKYWPTQA